MCLRTWPAPGNLDTVTASENATAACDHGYLACIALAGGPSCRQCPHCISIHQHADQCCCTARRQDVARRLWSMLGAQRLGRANRCCASTVAPRMSRRLAATRKPHDQLHSTCASGCGPEAVCASPSVLLTSQCFTRLAPGFPQQRQLP